LCRWDRSEQQSQPVPIGGNQCVDRFLSKREERTPKAGATRLMPVSDIERGDLAYRKDALITPKKIELRSPPHKLIVFGIPKRIRVCAPFAGAQARLNGRVRPLGLGREEGLPYGVFYREW
jgi:hypothetical protein